MPFLWFIIGVGVGVSLAPAFSGQMQPILASGLMERADPTTTSAGVATATATSNNPEPNRPSLTESMAASFFSIDPQTGYIQFPSSVKQVIIDVGARQSDYLDRLLKLGDKTIGLILFDPMPHSYIPVSNKASQYQMRNASDLWLDTDYMNSVFPVRAALADQEGTTEFNIGIMPSCGSLLEFKREDSPHWCMESAQKIKTVILRLESILNMIPPRIEDVHLKIDTEGFDLTVLKGGGQAVKRLRTVVIECINYKAREEIPTGTFNCSDALEYMDSFHTFEEIRPSSRGHGENLFWMQKNWTIPSGSQLPEFFKNEVVFQDFYRHVEKLLQSKS